MGNTGFGGYLKSKKKATRWHVGKDSMLICKGENDRELKV